MIQKIKSEIVKQLFEAKCSGKYDDLFEEFIFLDNGLFVASKQVEDGLSLMQLAGLISKKNPYFMELIVNADKNISNNVKCQVDYSIICKMKELVEEFVL